MKAKIVLALGAMLALAHGVRAAPPGQAGQRTSGKVLMLDNGRSLDGDIERHGEQYRIRREVGELWVPATPAMKLCSDWQEAFELMASRANLLDPDERLRLARWCQLHELRAQALAEALTALKMRPEHVESRQLVAILERSMTAPAPAKAAPPPRPADVPVATDISSDCVALFITRVQPILMNTCVSCHSGGKGGEFQLFRTYQGGTQAAAQKNLGAVLKQIDAEHPMLSPLLIKAICAHGNSAQPPIKRLSEPYRSMQGWINTVLRNNPQLKRPALPAVVQGPPPRTLSTFTLPAPAAAGVPRLEARQVAHETVEKEQSARPALPRTPPRFVSGGHDPGPARPELPEETRPVKGHVPLLPIPGEGARQPVPRKVEPPAAVPQTGFSVGQPARPPEPIDEFDPAPFNRQMHPNR